MRRNDKEITGRAAIEKILAGAMVCRVALIDSDRPYIIPMHFVYADNVIFLHSASRGRKIDIARENPVAAFEVDEDVRLVESRSPCGWGTRYRSVTGTGSASFVDDVLSKREILGKFMEKYSGRGGWEFTDDSLAETCVMAIAIDTMTGKVSGY